MLKKTLIIISYYILSIIMYLSIYKNIIWETDYVIYNFSKILFNICYNFIPIIFLSLPLIFKMILNKCFNKIMSYSYIITIMYIPILLIINLSITIHMKNFEIEKWNNQNIYLRHLMIDDFENTYKPIGKNKNDIKNILGETYFKDRNYDNSFCYVIGASGFQNRHYCFIYDNSNVIIDTTYYYH